MGFSKTVISAVLAATTAYAAVPCSSSDVYEVQNQGDASAISSCPKYTGDIEIKSSPGQDITFGTLGEIDGMITMDNDTQLTSLSFPGLKTLGSIELVSVSALSALDLSSLTSVGDVTFQDLVALSTFNLGKLKSTGKVIIENLPITDLSGLATATKVDSITVSNCQFLSNISFAMTDVGTIDIGPNNYVQGQQIVLPNLATADSLFLRNSSSVEVPSLGNVSNTLGLYGNLFTSFSAANLTDVGALVLEDNLKVTNFSFPNLVHINGENATLDIENNTALIAIDGFPKLEDVEGGATFAGNLQNVSLPSIKTITGALTLDTTVTDFDCTFINSLSSNQVAKGEVNCKPADPTPTGSGGVSSGGTSSSHNAAAPETLPTFLTTGAFAALLAILA